MKFTADNLSNALTITGAAIARNSTIPILDCVLLDASDGRLMVTGFDLETEIITTIPADINEAGAICVNALKLNQIVSRAPPGTIDIKTNDGGLVIKTAKSRHKLNILPSDEYPTTDAPKDGTKIIVPTSDFATHIGNVERCAAVNDVRTFLNGINIQYDNNKMVFNASDGHRLASSIMELQPGENKEAVSTILATKAAQSIIKTLRPPEIDLTIGAGSIRASDGQTIVTCRAITGKYPDLKDMLAARSEISAQIDAEELASTISRMESTTSDSFGILISFEPGKLIVNSADSNGQQSEADTEIEYDGEPMQLSYNWKYLYEAVKHISGPAILHLPDPQKQSDRGAIFIRPESDIHQYCLMPIRL